MRKIAAAIAFHCVLSAALFAASHDATPFSELPLDKNAIGLGLLTIPIRLGDGPEVLFVIDSGSPLTLVDRSLQKELGKRRGRFHLRAWDAKQKADVYAAPALFIGDKRLQSGSNLFACDFNKFFAGSELAVRGILGMDCLEKYCVQIDSAAGKLTFFEQAPAATNELGTMFPITLSTVGQSQPDLFRTFIQAEGLVGGKGHDLLVDTGLDADGAVPPEVLQKERRGSGVEKMGQNRWWFPEASWAGENYTNLIIVEAAKTVAGEGAGVLGMRFLARHLVTLDFPNRRLYLKKQSAEPLPTHDRPGIEALLPVDGKLPEDVADKLSTILRGERPPWWFRWFGGTITVKKSGDPTTWHFMVGRARQDQRWKLKKVWSSDRSGRVIQTIQMR
jgi:hypothetical protein